jgi:para-aminobenzoate synthetase component 1
MQENFSQKMNRLGKGKTPFLFVLDFDLKEPVVLSISEASDYNIFFDIEGTQNYTPHKPDEKIIDFRKFPIDYPTYLKSFENVTKHLRHGNSFLTNLTFPTPIESNISLEEIFHRSSAPFRLLFNNQFVVFSPEIFVRIRDGKIASYPMKGTIDANIPNAAEKILSDKKETAEHNTIVDLIRNDLSIVSDNVQVEKFRYIDKIQTNDKELLQVSSKITGDLSSDYADNIGDIIKKLLPAGSITGAPKRKTVEIIKESEIYKRGYYTGIFGIFDGKNLDSAVMIRFIENHNNKLIYKSGGGITVFSDPKKEYHELIDKVYVPIN